MFTRSFGLLSDHVKGFDIVLAEGKVDDKGSVARAVTVWKPDRFVLMTCV